MCVREAGGGYNMYSPPAGWGDGFLLIIVKGICPTAYCSGPLDEHCHGCMHVRVCDGSSVPLWHASVVLNEADFNGCLNEMPGP